MKIKAKMLGGIALASMAVSVVVPWNKVIRVVDGDTLVLANIQKVRLLGVDAPEMGLCGSREAKKELEKLVLGKKIGFGELRADSYGRVLAAVYIGETLVNEKMAESGWVRWDGNTSSIGAILRGSSDFARENEMGVFGKTCRSESNDKKEKCLVKGNIDKATGRKLYHFPGCREYETTVVEKELGENWYCSEKEAKQAGYEKSVNCFGKEFKSDD